MNENVANFLWVGSKLSMYERKCIESFVKNGFIVHVYSYGDLQLPAGAILKNGREILPESEVYSYTQHGKKGNLAAFSDAFRYQICNLEAGWWFDTDVFCIKHVDEWVALAKSKHGTFVMGYQNDKLINGAVMYSDSELFNTTISSHLERIGKCFPWGEIGPKLITKVLHEVGLVKSAVDVKYFYPIHFFDFNYFFEPKYKQVSNQKVESSFCVHLWNEFFTRFKIPKNQSPPKGSFLYELLSRYSGFDDLPNMSLLRFKYLVLHRKVIEKYLYLSNKFKVNNKST